MMNAPIKMTTHLLPGIAELVISEGIQATTCIDITKQGKNILSWTRPKLRKMHAIEKDIIISMFSYYQYYYWLHRNYNLALLDRARSQLAVVN
jgi:hypothetical protein